MMTRDQAIERAIMAVSAWSVGDMSPEHLRACASLAEVWLAIADRLPAQPKPASYLVDGLMPHNFRNDGTDLNQNACTWTAVRCGYGPNAQIHRRMATQGKNAQPAPHAPTGGP